MTTARTIAREQVRYWQVCADYSPVDAMEALGLICRTATWVEVEVVAELRYQSLPTVIAAEPQEAA